jgi:hypothetical protein
MINTTILIAMGILLSVIEIINLNIFCYVIIYSNELLPNVFRKTKKRIRRIR